MSVALTSLVTPETRLGAKRAEQALVGAAAGTVQVAAACAAAGVVVGVASAGVPCPRQRWGTALRTNRPLRRA